MSLFSRGREFLRGKAAVAEGLTATYTRGAHSATPNVWLGQTAFVSNVQDAARLERSELDVLMEASALILNGSVVTPLRGDRLTIRGKVFELMVPGTDEPCWRFSDTEQTILRLHCKRVS